MIKLLKNLGKETTSVLEESKEFLLEEDINPIFEP